MSFAEDMGHDIPDYDMDEGTGCFYTPWSKAVPSMVTFENVKLEHETEKALLLKIKGEKYWVPKSQVTLDGDEVEIPDWLVASMEPVIEQPDKFKRK
jgi:hypothetical protein